MWLLYVLLWKQGPLLKRETAMVFRGQGKFRYSVVFEFSTMIIYFYISCEAKINFVNLKRRHLKRIWEEGRKKGRGKGGWKDEEKKNPCGLRGHLGKGGRVPGRTLLPLRVTNLHWCLGARGMGTEFEWLRCWVSHVVPGKQKTCIEVLNGATFYVFKVFLQKVCWSVWLFFKKWKLQILLLIIHNTFFSRTPSP